MLRRLMMAGGGGGGSWVTSGSWVRGGNSVGWGGLTLRQRVPVAALVAGSKIRLTLQSAAASGCVISKVFIQHVAGSGDTYDFSAAPIQLAFAGGAGVTIPANSEVVTDEAVFTVNPTVPLIVSAYITSGDVAGNYPVGWSSYYKSGDDTTTVDAAGYSSSAYQANLFRKVEVFQP